MSLLDPHILILDDNASDAELTVRELRKAGVEFTAQCAPDKKAYLEALCEFVPDLVLTDYRLPAFDGLTAMMLARQFYENIPVIIVSGSIGEETAIEALKAGATDYILKPGFGRLGPAVDRALKENWLRLKCQESEAAFKRSEERFRTTFANAAVGIEQIGEDGRLLEVNPAICAMLGYSRDELLKRSYADLTHPEDLPGEKVFLAQLFSGEIPSYQLEKRCLNKQGQTVWVRVSSSLAQDSRSYRISVIEDITASKRAEEALREANAKLGEADRRKDEFLAMLAHELRNPLAPIRNAIHILNTFCVESCSRSETAQRQRKIIERQVAHMARLLDDLLDISRVTRGKIDLRKEPLRLAEVLAQAVETTTPLIESRRHQLHVSYPPDLVCVEGDIDRLAQVVGNLLTNAAKYTDEGGQIWLAGECGPREAVVRVRDNGLGIAPEMLPHVFELFAQADQSLGRSRGGLGIGLTMVQKLVQLHGGSIEAHSGGLGQGSEFIVRLPALTGAPEAAAPKAQPAPAGKPAANGGRPRRILIVDDMVDTTDSLAELLTTWGHEVKKAYSGASALETVRSFRPDVMLLDIGMPGMDGYEVARRLRQMPEMAEVQLIAMTGYGQEQDREAALQAGFDTLFVKPVDLNTLRENVVGSIR